MKNEWTTKRAKSGTGRARTGSSSLILHSTTRRPGSAQQRVTTQHSISFATTDESSIVLKISTGNLACNDATEIWMQRSCGTAQSLHCSRLLQHSSRQRQNILIARVDDASCKLHSYRWNSRGARLMRPSGLPPRSRPCGGDTHQGGENIAISPATSQNGGRPSTL